VRGLLMGTPVGDSWVVAISWCLGLSAVGALWAIRQYDRRSLR
jgi:ABC-2 type transport system permease protein